MIVQSPEAYINSVSGHTQTANSLLTCSVSIVQDYEAVKEGFWFPFIFTLYKINKLTSKLGVSKQIRLSRQCLLRSLLML
jgi:hypothetical protein